MDRWKRGGDDIVRVYKDWHLEKEKFKYTIKTLPRKMRRHKIITTVIILYIAYSSLVISQHMRFHRPDYVCRQMARDIEDTLETIGISTTIVTGSNNESGHVWIKIFGVDVDSVNLFPMNNRETYPQDLREYNDYEDFARDYYGWNETKFKKEMGWN